jgi:hypothetical protein
MNQGNKEEPETCTGQCGYSPLCRQCELEKKRKCKEAALQKKKNEEKSSF